MLAESPDHVVSVHPTPVAALSVLWSRGMRIPPHHGVHRFRGAPSGSIRTWTATACPRRIAHDPRLAACPRARGGHRHPGGPGVRATPRIARPPGWPWPLPGCPCCSSWTARAEASAGWRTRRARSSRWSSRCRRGRQDARRRWRAAAQPRGRQRARVKVRGYVTCGSSWGGRLPGDQGGRSHAGRGAGHGAAHDLLRLLPQEARNERFAAMAGVALVAAPTPSSTASSRRRCAIRCCSATSGPDSRLPAPTAADHRGLVLTQPDSARVRAS